MSLIERLKSAEGPSRELDAEIAKAFGERHGPHEDAHYESRSISVYDEIARPYTSALDAALALVEAKLPGWRWCVQSERADFFAYVWRLDAARDPGSQHVDFRARGTTPALALCIALLTALEATPTSGTGEGEGGE